MQLFLFKELFCMLPPRILFKVRAESLLTRHPLLDQVFALAAIDMYAKPECRKPLYTLTFPM